MVTVTIILPVSYARVVPVQRNLTLTVTGRREADGLMSCLRLAEKLRRLDVQTASMGRKVPKVGGGGGSRSARKTRRIRYVAGVKSKTPAGGARERRCKLAEREVALRHFSEAIILCFKINPPPNSKN